MFPTLQWDKLPPKVWSWLKGKMFQKHMQFEMECDLMWYENKFETIEGIHSLNFSSENIPNSVKKLSHKDHLPINVACVKM